MKLSQDSSYQKINLIKDGGPIVFLGGMNAMPMMYAMEIKKRGYEVLYFVDAPQSDTLSRPENHFSEIVYPYPDWIVEFDLKTQMLLPFFRTYFARKIEKEITKKTKKPIQAIVLNGFFCSLAPFLKSTCPKIALSHGSDLDSWADLDGVAELAESFSKQSVFQFLPFFLSSKLIRSAVKRQYSGASQCRAVIYFPKGFNPKGDRVLDRLKKSGVHCLERYDISFEPLKNESRVFKRTDADDKLIILSCVRFTFKTFSEGNSDYSKGNDLIIEGLAQYYKENPNIEVHFVEKGPDVTEAKRICVDTGLAPVVVWHKEMTFIELLQLYGIADICFDQVGKHWMGAVGGYALWLGKPLITNANLPINLGWWPNDNPIINASNSEQIYTGLKKLSDPMFREDVSDKSKRFAEENLSANRLLQQLFEFE